MKKGKWKYKEILEEDDDKEEKEEENHDEFKEE